MIVSKAGIHCVGSQRNGYGPFLRRIADAGRQLALVKCRDDFGAIVEPLALWPDLVTIGAMTAWDDARYNVDEALARIQRAAAKDPGIKYWEYYNERNGEYEQQADLYIALLPRLNAAGIGLCMFNSGKGCPQYADLDPGPYRAVARACKFAKQNGYRAILGLHEYEREDGQPDPHLIGRYKVLADYLEAHNALIPIAITEWGRETSRNDAKYLAYIKAIDQVYSGDDRVLGCALYTLGGRGWNRSNYQNMLPGLGEYIATVAPSIPAPGPIDPIVRFQGTCVQSSYDRITDAVVTNGGTIERMQGVGG